MLVKIESKRGKDSRYYNNCEMNIPGTQATLEAYWKLGVYNPWNRKCEISFEDDDGNVMGSCGVIFTKNPVGDRPYHASMELQQYHKPEDRPDGVERVRCGYKRRNPHPSGICNHCYLEEFSETLEDELGEDWVPINPKDPILIQTLSRIDATVQEQKDSTWILTGEFYTERDNYDRNISLTEAGEREEKRNYYDQIQPYYNLPEYAWFTTDVGLDEVQQKCVCTHPGRGENGLIYKYMIYNYVTKERLFVGSVCRHYFGAKKVCVNCKKTTKNWVDPWCDGCRKLRCRGFFRETSLSEKQCPQLAINPKKRLINERLCDRCEYWGEEIDGRIVRKSPELRVQDVEREERQFEEREREEKERERLRGDSKSIARKILSHIKKEKEGKCVSCGGPSNQNYKTGGYYPKCWSCKDELTECPYYSMCGNKFNANIWKHCWRCNSESWSR